MTFDQKLKEKWHNLLVFEMYQKTYLDARKYEKNSFKDGWKLL